MSIRALIEAQLPALEGEERRRAELTLKTLVERDEGDYPPLLEQAGNAIGSAGRFIASGLAVADEVERERRLAICRECPHFDAPQGRCKICGCLANLKARIASEHCPDNPPRW